MTLYRAFSVGPFKCSDISPKISVADYLSDGYVLKISKKQEKKFCIACARGLLTKQGFKITEDKKYLTIQSS